MEKSSKCNYTTRPIPSGPGALQITNEDLKSKKGGSEFESKLPEKNVVKDGSKSKK